MTRPADKRITQLENEIKRSEAFMERIRSKTTKKISQLAALKAKLAPVVSQK